MSPEVDAESVGEEAGGVESGVALSEVGVMVGMAVVPFALPPQRELELGSV